MVKLKRDLEYRAHVYFKPVGSYNVCQAFTYLKYYNKFYEDISVAKGLSSVDMFKFSNIVEVQGQSECVSENINDRSETEFGSF